MPRNLDGHLISISRIRTRGATEISCVRFRGGVREPTESEFRSRLAEAGRRASYLVVDLSELEYLSSAGLGLLLDQFGVQEGRGGWLRLVAPSSTVSMILDLAGTGATLSSFPSEDDAIRDLPGLAA